jgi:hypothetical protein
MLKRLVKPEGIQRRKREITDMTTELHELPDDLLE